MVDDRVSCIPVAVDCREDWFWLDALWRWLWFWVEVLWRWL
jgi:hypothetical protein